MNVSYIHVSKTIPRSQEFIYVSNETIRVCYNEINDTQSGEFRYKKPFIIQVSPIRFVNSMYLLAL